LARRLGDRVRFDVPIGPLTTYRVGGSASAMVTIESVDDLGRVATACSELGVATLVIGRGSNMLVADEGFEGLALQLGDFAVFVELPEPGDSTPIVRAGAATSLPVLARRTAGSGWRGLEWAVGVPGSVGGAVRMNAGGHGSDMAASLVDARVVDLTTGVARTRTCDELGLRFRGSDLDDRCVVTEVRLRVESGDAVEAQNVIDDIVKWRRENQPGGQNAGSVFVNPIPGVVAAGELIDRAGLRGFRIGTAEVSAKHANFIQADEGGRAADVMAVMRHVHERVLAESGHDLRSEVRLVGFA
jgi:UDP-N-acetylmuramate dehydrogenase